MTYLECIFLILRDLWKIKGLLQWRLKRNANGVQIFYRNNDIELLVLGKNKAKVLEKNKDIPTKEDL